LRELSISGQPAILRQLTMIDHPAATPANCGIVPRSRLTGTPVMFASTVAGSVRLLFGKWSSLASGRCAHSSC
jgi:hypothetical protein